MKPALSLLLMVPALALAGCAGVRAGLTVPTRHGEVRIETDGKSVTAGWRFAAAKDFALRQPALRGVMGGNPRGRLVTGPLPHTAP